MSYLASAQTSTSGLGSDSQKNRRKGDNAIPHNIDKYLNEDQVLSLRQMESFGWQLAFVRRPLFQEHVAVVSNSDSTKFGVLEDDGSINTSPQFYIRH